MMYPYPQGGSYPQGVWSVPEQRPPAPADGPAQVAPRGLWPDRFSLMFGIIVAIVTLCALVLGFVAPALGPGPAAIVPAGWTKTFDGPLVDDGTWENGGGCTFNSSGLDVQGGTQGQVCAFTPSTQRDLTSQGFALEVQLAAAANVQGDQRVVIAVGGDSDGARLVVAQSGQFALCRNTSEVCVPNLTDAWHGDSYVANSIALRYLPDTGGGGQLAYFANGQLVMTIGLDLGSSATLGIGAASNAEALFTHATVYSASA